ncbi:MAG: ABC transporter permease [Verrucomicrobiota bacterium]
MISFLIQRFLQSILVILLVVSGTFLLMRLAPGSPFATERKLPPKVEQTLLEKYDLDGNLGNQFLSYWGNLLKGQLGYSTKFEGRSVVEILKQALPKSLLLGFFSLVVALGLGILLGSYAAMNHQSWRDWIAMFLAFAGISLPVFVIAPLVVLLLGMQFRIFPVAGWGTLAHMFLPVLCLGGYYAAYCSRLMRASMLEVLDKSYIRTARSKGLRELYVIYKHAFKNAVLPLVSYSGPLAAHLFTGSMIVEEFFKIPGMGSFFVNGVLNRDVFLVGGSVIVYCTLLLAMNLFVDLLYVALDKRIKLW